MSFLLTRKFANKLSITFPFLPYDNFFCIISSLVSETIPYHRDYQTSLPNERAAYKRVRSCFANFYARCSCVYFCFVNLIFSVIFSFTEIATCIGWAWVREAWIQTPVGQIEWITFTSSIAWRKWLQYGFAESSEFIFGMASCQ